MKLTRVPKIRKDESLADWRAKLTETFNLSGQMQEILREVSVVSYTCGSNAAIETFRKS